MSFIQKIISRFTKKNGIFSVKLKNILGFSPKNLAYYEEAFTHSSFRNNEGNTSVNYQRLEFLGDAVLGLVTAHYLFKELPNRNEGHLTKMRAKMVRREFLNEVGNELQLQHILKVESDAINLGENISGNIFEALVGAIYLDAGYKKAENFIHEKLIQRHSTREFEKKVISYKSLIVEWGQKNKLQVVFETTDDQQPLEEVRYFKSVLLVGDTVFSKARHTSKKKAEEKAAKRAYYKIQQVENAKKRRKKNIKQVSEK